MATGKDWIEAAAFAISAGYDSMTSAEIQAVIEQLCPFKRDTVYVEVGSDADDYEAGMKDALEIVTELPRYVSDVGDLAYESGVAQGRRDAESAIAQIIASDRLASID